jgi:hypothetical protein
MLGKTKERLLGRTKEGAWSGNCKNLKSEYNV